MIHEQVFQMVDAGILVMDRECVIHDWNRWMENHSRIPSGKACGTSLFELYPDLDVTWFRRNVNAVFAFGNFAFFSQKIHEFLFPFPPVGSYKRYFQNMQQNCTLGPIRDDTGQVVYVYCMVQDVTEAAVYELRLCEMANRDGLTGAYNRKYFETRLFAEWERWSRYKRLFSIIIFDIDFFKKVNDTYGHLAGDSVLKEMTQRISRRLRSTDALIRYGGEEFCIILPETGESEAADLAEALRENIKSSPYVFEEMSVFLTVSLGVASSIPSFEDSAMMLKAADEALYQAKEGGRDRVVISGSGSAAGE